MRKPRERLHDERNISAQEGGNVPKLRQLFKRQILLHIVYRDDFACGKSVIFPMNTYFTLCTYRVVFPNLQSVYYLTAAYAKCKIRFPSFAWCRQSTLRIDLQGTVDNVVIGSASWKVTWFSQIYAVACLNLITFHDV